MIGINISDVISVLQSVMPQLIAIGVAIILATIVTLAVNRRSVRNVAVRKLVHSQSWLMVLVASTIAVCMMLFGPLATLLNNASITRYQLSQDTVADANVLAEDVQSEAITLLKNDDESLPLGDDAVNVFGWGSTNPVYGGTGSGSISDQYEKVSLLQGLEQAGIETNTELSELYTDYRADRPVSQIWSVDWTLPEVPAAQYSDSLIEDAKAFSDKAVIVIARVGGEGVDLPTDMTAEGITYTNNSEEYADFEAGEHYLQLSQTEQDLIDLVTSNFDDVTLIYNGANAFQFDFLDQYPQIQSVLWCPPTGQTGFSALGEVLTGAVNPSGKTSDTFVRNLKQTPTWNNFGSFFYDNVDEFVRTSSFSGADVTPSFVNYTEGIYVGYKFYETAADEGAIDYDAVVQYPFGYGLSYTTFSQGMGDVTYADGTVSFDVTVTNTGDTAGKDVVEVYYNPPYTNGGIEKTTANLVEFAKTDELAPGESQTISIEFEDDDMASYDYENAEAYVLEAGDYVVSINSDSHTVIDEQTVNVAETITYDTESNTHDGDQTVATNQFEYAEGDLTYLSRADGFANYAEATAAPTNYSMSDEQKTTFINNGNYDPADYNDDSDEMPTTGADNGVRLADLTGKDYDDPLWDDLLDQLTFDDMDNLIANAGFGNAAIDSIGKIQLTDADGPAALNNNFTGVGSIGFPSSTAFACTWNVDLATRFGEMIARMAQDMHISGWYAPAMNIHRSAFGGRNFEYFSEDALLSGVMASSEIAAVQKEGVYAFMKHFALNDQETNRNSMLCTWSNEQAIREIYLKPFEMSVKDGGATAAMSSFNYIGTTYAGGYAPLLNTVLRDEWGFRGFVETDYFGNFDVYQNADQAIRNGNDAMLSTMDTSNHVSDTSATSVQAMRTAAHNILYTTANSWMYAEGEPETVTPVWKTITYVAIGVIAVLVVGFEVLTIRRYLSRRADTVSVA
ncbi:beta-glucosidase-related glycosidase [Bifidobacterium lemurum]|uniref:Beta-glucosidase-related glycosidase n=2 Tax=Bifidobacterium lemurum TaxID=1603886 RepID=A0A261FNX4_9BIFI|nr:glycoside hydrolase family 3 N-terminal domain-containing protein [Bifidobacterium lemurum]OZG60673.1 beta-glucosidase-related glycosidase [Bifidobacterium lemurum]QOL34809.1 glycoside hydrolase family 3 C-terminal domain-containing protein [Bifidobacterium lemurum]